MGASYSNETWLASLLKENAAPAKNVLQYSHYLACSLTPASGLHIMERERKKKQVVGVLAHSLPMVLPEGLPWKQGVRQALGGPATAAGTSFLTG